ncbi:MAG TPA: histidine kinase dimerization/phospho-acceptor domain-containing protein [Candidatus Deferrimicrobium sp.]|nr:histidine kinase dimerization/phospho-acceptor domain-containing protein [Candidatus Deferrimicrobium sp.]
MTDPVISLDQPTALSQATLLDGLDRIGIGLFRVNTGGYITEFNGTAADILDLDGKNLWEDLHVSRVDRVLATGLADQFEAVVHRLLPFTRRNLACTNARGRFMVLNVACLPIRAEPSGSVEVLGILADCADGSEPMAESDRRYEQLRVLSDVATALSSSFELEHILKIILTGATASQGLGFNRAFLFLYDECDRQLRGHLAIGPSSAEEAGHIWKSLDALRLSLSDMLDVDRTDTAYRSDALTDLIATWRIDLTEDSVLTKACMSGEAVNLDKVHTTDPIMAGLVSGLGARHLALVPMLSKGSLMGLIAADNAITDHPLTDESVRMLHILANQAAVAIQRAKLYDAERDRVQQLEQMNRQLGESQEQLIKIEKMSIIGELTSAVAHELKNPLTIIGGFAGLLLRSNLTDEQREYLNIVAGEVKRTESVLEHVLDFSRSSKNEHRRLDLSALVAQNVELLRARSRCDEVPTSLSLSNERLTIFGNYDQLAHAVYETLKLLIDDLVPPGRIEARTERKADRACLTIRISCPEADRERVVKAFRQTFGEQSPSHRLSVLVAVETIRHHGGELGLASASDGMPYLYIELPLVQEEGNDAAHSDHR